MRVVAILLFALLLSCGSEELYCPDLWGESCSAILLPEMDGARACNACEEEYTCIERPDGAGGTVFELQRTSPICTHDSFGLHGFDHGPDSGWP